MGENDLIQITSLIDNCTKNKYTFMETYKTVSNWIQNNKKTFIGITGLGAVVLAGFTAYYGGRYVMKLIKSNDYGNYHISDEDLNKEIPSGPILVNEQSENRYMNSQVSIVFNENDYVPDVKLHPKLQKKIDTMYTDIKIDKRSYKYIKELLDKNINLDVISGPDKYLTPNECKNALDVIDIKNDGLNMYNYKRILDNIDSAEETFIDVPKNILIDVNNFNNNDLVNKFRNNPDGFDIVKNADISSKQFYKENNVNIVNGVNVRIDDIVFLKNFQELTSDVQDIVSKSIEKSYNILQTGINTELSKLQYLFQYKNKFYAFNNYEDLIALKLINGDQDIPATVLNIDKSQNFEKVIENFNNMGEKLIIY